MNADRINAMLRQLLPVVGTLATLLGWTNLASNWGVISEAILQLVGPVCVIVGIVWSWIANSKSSIIQSVAAMDETSVNKTTGQITINDPKLAAQAVASATPPKGQSSGL